MRKTWSYGLAGACFAFFAAFLLWPLADSVVRSVSYVDAGGARHFTLAYLANLFGHPLERDATVNAFLIAVGTTILATLIALPLAWLSARRSYRGKTVLSGLLLAPLVMPPFMGTVGMKMLFARAGPVNLWLERLGFTGGPVDWFGQYPLACIMVLEALHLFPILYLNVSAAFANVDPTLEAAAANLGATPWRVFRRVTLPLAAPGVFAGTTLVFLWSFTELGTPLMFGFRDVLPVRLYANVNEIGYNPTGFAQTTFLLVVTLLGYALAKRAAGRGRDQATLGRLASAAPDRPLSRGGTVLAWLATGLVIFLAVLPHLSVTVLATARHWSGTLLPQGWTADFFRDALADPGTRTALRNSLLLSAGACALDLVLGFGIAWLCVRRKLRGSGALDALAMLPLAVPGVVVAFGYLGCFSGNTVGRAVADAALWAGNGLSGWMPAGLAASWEVWSADGLSGVADALGHVADPRVNPMPLLAVSYAVRRLPYMTRAAHAGLEQISPAYEEAARNLGATPARTLWRVTLPLVSANLLGGGVLCFAFSMLEVSDSLILAQQPWSYPLTKAIYDLSGGLEWGPNLASALAIWAVLLLAAALLYAGALMGRRMGQAFRAG